MSQKNITQWIDPEEIASDLGISLTDANKITRDLNRKFKQHNPNKIIIPGKVYRIWYEQHKFNGTSEEIDTNTSKDTYILLSAYDDILTPDDLQSILHSSRNTIYKCLADGSIPSVRIGDKYYISKTNLIGLLENPPSQIKIAETKNDKEIVSGGSISA